MDGGMDGSQAQGEKQQGDVAQGGGETQGARK